MTERDGADWKQLAINVKDRVKRDHVLLSAAGVAFFAFLAIIPAMVAVVSIYGLVGDPEAIEERVNDFAAALPDEVRELVVQQLEGITNTSDGALTVSLVVALALSLWSASSGMGYLVEAVNMAHRRVDSRGFVQRRLLSMGFTFGALVFVVITIGVITALPAVMSATGLPGAVRWLVNLTVWPVVGLGLVAGLALLYRVAPDRDAPDPDEIVGGRWFTPGAGLAVAAWLVASVGFQIYAANFGSYNETYGSLGAVVVLLLWIWISALVVLIGAHVNAAVELERSTQPEAVMRAHYLLETDRVS